jgi:hypothetical protein
VFTLASEALAGLRAPLPVRYRVSAFTERRVLPGRSPASQHGGTP